MINKMTLDEFTNFFYDVCTIDYAKMEKAMEPLKQLLSNTKEVHILGKNTDLKFSAINVIPFLFFI